MDADALEQMRKMFIMGQATPTNEEIASMLEHIRSTDKDKSPARKKLWFMLEVMLLRRGFKVK